MLEYAFEKLLKGNVIIPVCVLLIAYILTWFNKDNVFKEFLYHPRFCYKNFSLLIINGALYVFWNDFHVTAKISIITIDLTILLTMINEKISVLPEGITINRLRKLLKSRRYDLIEKRFKTRPIMILSQKGKVKWILLWFSYLKCMGEYVNAFRELIKLDKFHLLPKEKIDYYHNKIRLLIDFGDISSANRILEQNKELFCKDDYTMFLKSLIYENMAEFKKFESCLYSSIDSIEKGNKRKGDNGDIAYKYNTLGRMYALSNRLLSARDYYKKALKYAKQTNDKELIYTIYQNSIDINLRLNSEESEKMLHEFKLEVNLDNPYDNLEYLNYLLEYYRQCGDIEKIHKILDNDFSKLVTCFESKRYLLLHSSILRIRFNMQYHWKAPFDKLVSRLDEVIQLPFSERLKILYEILNICCYQLDKRMIQVKPPTINNIFDILYKLGGEINTEIIKVPDYCVNLKSDLRNKQTYIYSKIRTKPELPEPEEFFMTQYKKLLEVRQDYFDHGNILKTIDQDLLICETALIMEKAVPDKAISYTKKHLQLVTDIVDKNITHITFNGILIQIAFYSYAIGDFSTSKRYYECFNEIGISIQHYAFWLSNFYDFLKKEFNS